MWILKTPTLFGTVDVTFFGTILNNLIHELVENKVGAGVAVLWKQRRMLVNVGSETK